MEDTKGKRPSGLRFRARGAYTGIISTGLAMGLVAVANVLASNNRISAFTEHSLNLTAILLFSIPPMYAALRSRSGPAIKLTVTMGAFLLSLHEIVQLINNAYPGMLGQTFLDLRPLLLGLGFCLFIISMYFSITRMATTQEVLYTERQLMSLEIAERRQAEEKLRQSEEKYRELVENANSIILRMDKEGRLTFFNDFALRFFGYSHEEIIGRNVVGTIVPETDSAGRNLRAMIEDICLHPERYDVNQNENMLRDGTRVWVDWTNKPLANASGELVEILSVGSDITARKRAEEERVHLESQLYQARKMESVGRLAGGVAHDFNNMLGVILGFADMAMTRVDRAQPIYGDLREICAAANRSADLTRQLLAFARRQTVTPKVLDLNAAVTGMLKILHRLIGENIELDWRPGPDLWPVLVDPSQMDQILANLCVNARDAIAGTGKVTIETENRSLDGSFCAGHVGVSPGDYVLLTVEDDGRGMDEETLTSIFEPFFTTKGVGEGTGLGLATVYGAVEQNGGFIDVQSERGRGTLFNIYLPRHAGSAATAAPENPTPPKMTGHETILLVEDEPTFLKMAMTMLERQGYTVLAATTPGEALLLAEARGGAVDLLMTDVVMPEMNGRDLAIKLLTRYPRIKRLFMSGYTSDIIAHNGVVDDGTHFIQKPFSVGDLAAKVRETLDSA